VNYNNNHTDKNDWTRKDLRSIYSSNKIRL